MSKLSAVCVLAVMVGLGVVARAQTPPAPAAGGARGRGAAPARQAGPPEAYPQHPPADPAVLERGKALYSVNCAFCHGIDARGGDGGGPNLLRSQLVLSDQNGEQIGQVVESGRPNATPPMPPLKLTAEQVSDIAAYIHSFRVGGYDVTRQPPVSIVVGDAKAGQAAFASRCAPCHSVSGDLQGLASRYPDPHDLQQAWIMPSATPAAGRGRGGVTPTSNSRLPSVTVTLPSGQRVQGRLVRIDDFVVSLEQADGTPRSFSRNGDSPKVEITDPLKPHRDLLPKYTDKEIHDITAYLVGIK